MEVAASGNSSSKKIAQESGYAVVVQNGSTSAVGRGVIELASAWGIKTINLIRNGSNAEQQMKELYELGATLVVKEGTARAEARKLKLDGVAHEAITGSFP